jgi:hypothetical protein
MVRVSRDLFDDGAFKDEPFTEREAFLWLIMEASFKDRERRVGNHVVVAKRGQVAASSRFMAKAWGWAEPRVRRYLERVKNRRMIECVADAGITIITLCNYDKYQSAPRVDDAKSTQQPTRDRRTTDANENKDEIRVEKREANASLVRSRFSEFWDAYPHRGGKRNRAGAVKSYEKAVKRGISEQAIIDGARLAHNDRRVREGYARDPTTWLNQEGWADEIDPNIHPFPSRKQTYGERTDEAFAAAAALVAQRPFG